MNLESYALSSTMTLVDNRNRMAMKQIHTYQLLVAIDDDDDDVKPELENGHRTGLAREQRELYLVTLATSLNLE